MTSEKTSTSPQKVCPTCGTRLSENATRCSVCGRAITPTATPQRESDSTVREPRMPAVTLSLPLFIGLFILLIAIGAGAVYAFARQTPALVVDFTRTPTPTSHRHHHAHRHRHQHQHPGANRDPDPAQGICG
jgi:hypothetical protein